MYNPHNLFKNSLFWKGCYTTHTCLACDIYPTKAENWWHHTLSINEQKKFKTFIHKYRSPTQQEIQHFYQIAHM